MQNQERIGDPYPLSVFGETDERKTMIEHELELKEILSKGNSAAWDQKWKDAADYYHQALDIDSNNFMALTNLGLAYYEMRDYQEALNAYGTAVALNTDNPAPYEKMFLIFRDMDQPEDAIKYALRAAESHLKNEDIQKAIENWKHVIEIDVKNIKAHARLGMVYERLGKIKLAISEYINTASLLQITGNTKKALESIGRALQCSPENIIALRAMEILNQGRQLPLPEPVIIDAEQDFLPDTPQFGAPSQAHEVAAVYENPIQEALDKAMIELAAALFEEAIPSKKSSKPQNQGRDLESALSWNTDLKTDLSDDSKTKLHVSQAIEQFSSGMEKEAVVHIKSAINDGYSNPAAYFLLGYLYINLGRVKSASRWLSKSVSHENFALASRLLLAKVYSTMEKWNEASKEYIEALRIADTSLVDKENVEDLIHLYEVMMDELEKQEGDDAFIEMSKHIEELLLRSDWREILVDMRSSRGPEGGILLPQMNALLDDRRSQIMGVHKDIQNLAKEGYYGAAMEKAFFALRTAPSFLPLHITIGDILVEQEKISGAVTKYLAVANVYTVQSKTERALSMLQKVIDLQPMNIEIRQRRINLLEEYGKKLEAIQEYVHLAEVFFPLAELDSARTAYLRAYELAKALTDDGGWSLKLLLRLADIDIQRLDWDSAIETFEVIIKIFPNNRKASMSIVDLNFRLGKQHSSEREINRFILLFDPQTEGDQIHQYLLALKEEMPRETYIIQQLVDLYLDGGQNEKAIAELDGLGDILLEDGLRTEAISVVEQIISLSPPNIGSYQKLIEQLQQP
jgi:tetratricopeptide (TPR) repeat protein